MTARKAKEMNWQCKIDGCFNIKKRLKFKSLVESTPKLTGISDIDGIIELNGNALMLEWKGYEGNYLPNNSIIPVAQRIMFTRITRGRMISAICVAGDAEDMSVKAMCVVRDGVFKKWRWSSIEDLNRSISEWVRWSELNPRV